MASSFGVGTRVEVAWGGVGHAAEVVRYRPADGSYDVVYGDGTIGRGLTFSEHRVLSDQEVEVGGAAKPANPKYAPAAEEGWQRRRMDAWEERDGHEPGGSGSGGGGGGSSKANARGLASKHGEDARPVCMHPGCTAKAKPQALCRKHTGDAARSRAVSQSDPKVCGTGRKLCNEPGCTSTSRTAGKCRKHETDRYCKHDGCKLLSHVRGLCRKHKPVQSNPKKPPAAGKRRPRQGQAPRRTAPRARPAPPPPPPVALPVDDDGNIVSIEDDADMFSSDEEERGEEDRSLLNLPSTLKLLGDAERGGNSSDEDVY